MEKWGSRLAAEVPEDEFRAAGLDAPNVQACVQDRGRWRQYFESVREAKKTPSRFKLQCANKSTNCSSRVCEASLRTWDLEYFFELIMRAYCWKNLV